MKINKSKALFIPPISVQQEAQAGLNCIKLGSKAGTRVGRIRARQLANGNKISFKIITRMKSFFDRHEKNKSYSGKKCNDLGAVAWLLWCGDSGKFWANQIYEKYK